MTRAAAFTGAGAAVLLAVFAAASGTQATQTVTRRYTAADRERERYVYVPFDVAAGTTELRIAYTYDRAGGQNTIDLGVFEPGPLDLHTSAMRGYSGGSKAEVTIGQCESSPGYKTGVLPPGRWHVMLGLYQVAAAGVDVTVTARAVRGEACVPPGNVSSILDSRRGTPERRATWWSGALHTHTLHSDGAVTPADLLRRIDRAGLDFVTITDHNNTTHAAETLRHRPDRAARPLWIIGEEITTPGGHANAWGLAPGGWVDFRVRPHENRIGELIDAAHRQGALFSINHPVSDCSGCSWEHEIPAGVQAVEVWNGRHGAQERAVALWEGLLGQGRRVTAVGASDWHRDPDPIDTANVRVLAPELGERAILDGIRAGRVIVMRAASDPTPQVTVASGGRTAAVGDTLIVSAESGTIEAHAPRLGGGRVAAVLNGRRLPPVALGEDGRARFDVALAPGYVRLEIHAGDGALVALTNPVYLTR